MRALALLLFLELLLCASLSAIPGVRVLEYLHAQGQALDLTWPQRTRAVYISSWQGTADAAVINAVDQGFNVVLIR